MHSNSSNALAIESPNFIKMGSCFYCVGVPNFGFSDVLVKNGIGTNADQSVNWVQGGQVIKSVFILFVFRQKALSALHCYILNLGTCALNIATCTI